MIIVILHKFISGVCLAFLPTNIALICKILAYLAYFLQSFLYVIFLYSTLQFWEPRPVRTFFVIVYKISNTCKRFLKFHILWICGLTEDA